MSEGNDTELDVFQKGDYNAGNVELIARSILDELQRHMDEHQNPVVLEDIRIDV